MVITEQDLIGKKKGSQALERGEGKKRRPTLTLMTLGEDEEIAGDD
jgi:hypothetical protein